MFKEFLEKYIPGPDLILIWTIPFLIIILSAAIFTSYLKKKNVKTGYTRKTFHILIFTTAGVLHLTLGIQAVILFSVLVSAGVLFAVIKGSGFSFYEAMARESDAPYRTLFILIPLVTTALGGLISNLLFFEFAIVGYLVGGYGDGLAEPVGTRWGKHKYRVISLTGTKVTRSLEGSLAVFVAGGIAAFIALNFSGYSFWESMIAAFAASLTGAVVEAVSAHGLDNLTIQVAASAVAFYILR